ncbi:MAG: stage II sporulation protein M, partial [Gemmatimonadaceae bacterium]
ICLVTFILVLILGVQVATRMPGARSATATAASSEVWLIALAGIMQFAIVWLYYVLFEALADGQTPGKRVMHLRVVRDGGLSVTFEASAIRNLIRIVDLQPVLFYAVGMITIIANARGKRLGDFAAGTIVVKEDLISQPMATKAARKPNAASLPVPLALAAKLTEEQYTVLDRFVQRRMDFDAERRNAFATDLVRRFGNALPLEAIEQPVNYLVRLHDDEHNSRALGVASRNDTGAARERHAIVATNAPRWAAFAERLKAAQRHGLKGIGEQETRTFVQEYRELTADLARLRTATRGTESADLFYLNRLVAGAHSLLYRRRSITLKRTINFVFGEVPAEIRRSFLPIGLAALLLFGPAFVAARAIILHPELATSMLPPSMLDRAETGVQSAKTGKGYVKDPEIFRPVMSSRIITNNVQVTFLTFAAGITAGIFTVFFLVSNGISMGAVLGLYMSKDIGKLLMAFVAPHGVLELSAIAIAGGGGFLLAAAMLIPGNRTRRSALVENGKRAIKLIAGCTFLLVIAGSLEGFVSPNANIPVNTKFIISAITAVGLVLYIRPWAGREVYNNATTRLDL